ncbi:xanthine phosphoribosyltransferase [Candidatus Bipolaricaulota bacterium]|nr:xanthine phosphoribosyltransferase [Candidatus Bipolaricaulota bacterium]
MIRDWIRREGRIVGPEFLRVDGFLNHRIVPEFIEAVGEGLAARFAESGATCVLTAEAAGNIVAYELARRLGARAVYAKKGKASTMAQPMTREILSPTKGTQTTLSVSGEYLTAVERVLVVDDFLFQGTTSSALADMVLESGATLAGFGFVIEKTFAEGRERLESYGVPVVALVSIAAMDGDSGEIEFVEAERA